PLQYAQSHGAKGLIAFGTFGNLSNWDVTRWNQSEKGQIEFGKPQTQTTVPTLTVTPRVIAAIFAGEKIPGGTYFSRSLTGEAMDSFDLKATKKVAVSVAVKSENIHTQNVVGILEGSDPVLKNEYVAVGAHYDHVGTNPFSPNEDKIWNGADDDGSG